MLKKLDHKGRPPSGQTCTSVPKRTSEQSTDFDLNGWTSKRLRKARISRTIRTAEGTTCFDGRSESSHEFDNSKGKVCLSMFIWSKLENKVEGCVVRTLRQPNPASNRRTVRKRKDGTERLRCRSDARHERRSLNQPNGSRCRA